MSEEVVVRYHFVGGGCLDCEFTDKDMYWMSVDSMDARQLIIIDNKVINLKNVTYSEIIKESVINIDKYY